MSARAWAKALGSLLMLVAGSAALSAFAAGADLGQAEKQPTNWTAISMFAVFVIFTLFVTKWAAAKTKSAADFYTAGGGSPASRTGWRLPATTCRPRRSWASRRR